MLFCREHVVVEHTRAETGVCGRVYAVFIWMNGVTDDWNAAVETIYGEPSGEDVRRYETEEDRPINSETCNPGGEI